jgi:hypothetical protein
MGDKTYAEIVYELLSAHAGFVVATGLVLLRGILHEQDVRLGFGRLDPSRCYSFGFRHPNFHPLPFDPAGVWNIQAADLSSGAPLYGVGLPFIPHQLVYTRDEIISLAAAHRRFGVGSDETGLQLADLAHINRSALVDAKRAIRAGGPPALAPSGVHLSPLNYGFILRSRNPVETRGFSDILCESPLLRRVRLLVYLRPPRRVGAVLNEHNRIEFCALKAFLTPADHDEFLELFPLYEPRYAEYRVLLKNIVERMLDMLRRGSTGENAPSPVKIIAREFLDLILRHVAGFSAFQTDAPDILRELIAHPDYAIVFLRALGFDSSGRRGGR